MPTLPSLPAPRLHSSRRTPAEKMGRSDTQKLCQGCVGTRSVAFFLPKKTAEELLLEARDSNMCPLLSLCSKDGGAGDLKVPL